jgi:predicted O-linked N-acetylglucosamine transferase (SPINDLY family)
VAQTLDDYVSVAAALARDPERLAGYRRGLRAHLSGSPLLDGARFARSFEAALRSMMPSR